MLYSFRYMQKGYRGRASDLGVSYVWTISTTCLLSFGLFLIPVIQKIGFPGTMAIWQASPMSFGSST